MNDRPVETIDYLGPRQSRRRGALFLVLLLFSVLFGAGTTASYYVEALWFGSLGYAEVFWRTLNIQATLFAVFTGATFAALYGAFLALKPATFGDLGSGGVIFINGRPVTVPVGPVLRVVAIVLSVIIALVTGAGMMSNWSTFA